MSLETVVAVLKEKAPDIEIVDVGRNHTTAIISELWRLQPAQVAKTLLLQTRNGWIVVVTCGDSRLDNRKLKDQFGGRARVAAAPEAEVLTGHPVGGICPLGLKDPLPVYLDIGLRRFNEVVPGAGSTTHAFRIAPARLCIIAEGKWVDICGSIST